MSKKKAPKKPAICICFEAHQPIRLIEYDFFRIGEHAYYDNDWLNEEVTNKVSSKCYEPVAHTFMELIDRTDGKFRCAISFTGTLLEQLEKFRPQTLDLFKELVATGAVEIPAETYYHSLASQFSPSEFHRQVKLHRDKIKEVFGIAPTVFRNTELIYTNWLASEMENAGYKGIIAEGVAWFLGGDSPNFLYQAPNVTKISTLLRNTGLSDDVGIRFSDDKWEEYPITAEKFTAWIEKAGHEIAMLSLHLETIGEHQDYHTGIFEFWKYFPIYALEQGFEFITPSEALDKFEPVGKYDSHHPTSWADSERDLTAWLGNVMQYEALRRVYQLEEVVLEANDPGLLHTWAKLQTSDHFYYMSTKSGLDGERHSSLSHHRNPYNAYIYFMNALADIEIRVKRLLEAKK